MEIKKIYQYVTALLISFFLVGCSDNDGNLVSTNFYYLVDEHEINASNVSSTNFNPGAMMLANDKLYVCNSNELLIFDALTYKQIGSITKFVKGNTQINLTALTSVHIHGGKIYLGSQESRLFVFDQENLEGITFVGNGQWWQTFVHVYGVAVSDEFVFVKEKENSIKVFQTAAINADTPWNLAPIAKITTKTGGSENYSMKIEYENLVIAGRNSSSYLYYNIASIRANAEKSFEKAIEPETYSLNSAKPIALDFNGEWGVGIENKSGKNYINVYPRLDFMYKKYNPVVSSFNPIGGPNFANITDIVMYNDLIFVTDNTNKKIQILKLKASAIQEK